MPQVSVGGQNFTVQAEAWPPFTQGGGPAQTQTPLSSDEIGYLEAFPGFGRADKAGQWPGYDDHAGTTAYGVADPVIDEAACWNWALTGATVYDRDTMLQPSMLIDLCNHVSSGLSTRDDYLRVPGPGMGVDTLVPLRAFEQANMGLVTALLAMPQRSPEEKRVVVEAIVRIMCAVKGMTFPASGSSAPYSICCEYSVTNDKGAPVPPNWTHWGVQFGSGQNQSLQTVPDCGIWKNAHGSFSNEWTHPGDQGRGVTAVVSVPVATLTPAHMERIRGILRFNRIGGGVGGFAQRLRCSETTCGRIHGSSISVVNLWHRCRHCNRVFCDRCGAALPRPAGGCFGREMTRERECPCGGRTQLLSRADG